MPHDEQDRDTTLEDVCGIPPAAPTHLGESIEECQETLDRLAEKIVRNVVMNNPFNLVFDHPNDPPDGNA